MDDVAIAVVAEAPAGPTEVRLRSWMAGNLPWLLLILFSITFAEFLTGSTPVLTPLLDPVSAIFLVGLYGGGVLLVRDAAVRWSKGWPTIFALGIGYGIIEEGIGTKTFFGPAGVGPLAVYGHAFGINWVWAVELACFHAIFSITLPILMIGLLFPRTRGRPFLPTRTALVGTLGAFLATVAAMFVLFRPGETPGPALLAGTLGAIAICLIVGRLLPRSIASLHLPGRTVHGPVPYPGLRGGIFGWGFFGWAWLGPTFIPYPAVTAVALAGWVLLFAVDIARHREGYAAPRSQLDFAFGALSLLLVLATVETFFGDYGAIAAVAGTVYLYVRIRARIARRTPEDEVPPVPGRPTVS